MRDLLQPEVSGVHGNWREDYQRKLVTAEEAVKLVKSGDRVVFPSGTLVVALPSALAVRKDELEDVTIDTIGAAAALAPFFQEGMEDTFHNTSWYFGDFVRTAPTGSDSKHTVYRPETYSMMMKPFEERPDERPFEIDVVMVSVSPPDDNGFCSFGAHLWTKRSYCKRAKTVLAEVDESHIRTGGMNYIHVSEIDRFVEHTPPPLTDKRQEEVLSQADPEVGEFLRPLIPRIPRARRLGIVEALCTMDLKTAIGIMQILGLGNPPEEAHAITGHVSELMKDGDTFQIGVGSPSVWITTLGAFDSRRDLGIYTEVTSPGYGRLVTEGIVTGKYKNFHPGKVTASGFSGGYQEDFDLIADNPIFEQYDTEYINDIRNIAQIDNFVAINNAISVDLTGQINAETGIGDRMINGPGGQIEMHTGAILSRGGRAITLLPSTALNGAVSRIVAQLDQGAVVTIPRYYADYIVTEYGIARLLGKNCRQRAEALIAVAHPDYRAELRAAAQEFFYP